MKKLKAFLKMTRLFFGESVRYKKIAFLILDPNSKIDYSKISDGLVKISINKDIYYAEVSSSEPPFIYKV